jgi:hypothetical protein
MALRILAYYEPGVGPLSRSFFARCGIPRHCDWYPSRLHGGNQRSPPWSFYIFQALPGRLNHGRIATTAIRCDVHSSPAPGLRQLFVA